MIFKRMAAIQLTERTRKVISTSRFGNQVTEYSL